MPRGSATRTPPSGRRPYIETVEPRLLYSADFGSALVNDALQALTHPEEARRDLVVGAGIGQEATTRVEVVVLSSRVPDLQALLADLHAQQEAGRALEVLVLDDQDDGIARLGALLAQRQDIGAVHVLTHGADGVVQLGAVRLDAATLLARAGEIAAWGQALAADADVLLYGCDVAAGSPGRQLVSDLAALTGADVAASDDDTGSALLGGDWTLEVASGAIGAAPAVSRALQADWAHLLPNTPPTISTIASQSTDEDSPLSNVSFTVGDPDGLVSAVTVTATSSNQTLIPNANLVVSGTGIARTISVTPAANRNGGPVTITLTATDSGGATATSSFQVTINAINDAPLASGTATLTAISEDTADPPGAVLSTLVAGVYNDATADGVGADAALGAVAIVKNNATSGGSWQYRAPGQPAGQGWVAVPTSGLAGTSALVLPADYELRFLPNANWNGTPGTLVVRLADSSQGAVAFAASEDLTEVLGGTNPWSVGQANIATSVTAVNDLPTISHAGTLVNRTINEDANTGALAFTVGDVETAATSLTVTRASSNTTLVPVANIALGGSGASRNVTVTPIGNQAGTATITLTVTDANAGISTVSFDLTVTAVNDAPTFTGSATLAAVNEDTTNPPGATVQTLFLGNYSDAADNPTGSATAFQGVAVVGNTADSVSQGRWQYFRTSNSTWTNIGSVSDTSALTLLPSDQLRFVPAGNYNSTTLTHPPLVVRLADGSGASLNSQATGVNLGSITTTSRWSAQVNLTTSITAVNDAPSVSDNSTLTVNEDDTNPGGIQVSSLSGYSDVDGDAFRGIAIVSNATNAADEGRWEYSASGTGAWQTVSTAVSTSSALLLPASYYVRFVPAANFSGESAGELTFRVSDAAVTFNTSGNLTGLTGGTGNWSSNTARVSASVTGINDAPVAVGNASATPVDEDSAPGSGQTVLALFGGPSVYDNTADGWGASALQAVAIVANNATAAQGSWQYSADGSTWDPVPRTGLANTTALVLPDSYRLRFVPKPDFNGTPGTLLARLADNSVGGSTVTFAESRDITAAAGGQVGGAGVWSADTASLTISVTPVNDAPDASGSATLASIVEDSTNPPGALASALFDAMLTEPVDGGTPVLGGVAVVGNAANGSTEGAWQSSPDGTTWTTLSTSASDTSARVLPPGSRLRFLPVADFAGTPGGLTLRLADDSGGTVASPQTQDLSSLTGGSNRWSQQTVTLGTSVTGVNDAPVNVMPASLVAHKGVDFTFFNGSLLRVQDVDSPTLDVRLRTTANVALTLATTANLTVDDNGTSDVRLSGTVAAINAALNGMVAATPNSSGSFTLTVISTDPSSLTDEDETTINVVNNQESVVTTSTGSVSFAENAAVATVIDSGVVVSDADSANLTGATVEIVGNFTAGQDQLVFTNQNGITGTYSASTGVLTLTGTATVAQYQAALRTVGYSNTSDGLVTATRTVAFSVDDGNGRSPAATRSVTLTAFNDAPTATGAAVLAAIVEDGPSNPGTALTTALAGRYWDGADGPAATGLSAVAIVGNAATASQGTWQVKAPADASWTNVPTSGLAEESAWVVPANYLLRFNPVANWNGTPGVLTVRVADGTASVAATPQTGDLTGLTGGTQPWSTGSATVGITVTAQNDAPDLSVVNTQTINEDSSTSTRSFTITDPDDSVFTVTATSSNTALVPESGIVLGGSGMNRTVKVTPTGNAFGTATITLTVTEAGGLQQSGTRSFDVVVSPVNDAPVASTPLSAPIVATSINEDTPTTGQLVSALFGSAFSDSTDGTEATSLTAVAIVGNAANSSSQGRWEYSSDGGDSWSNISTSVATGSALVLPTDYRLRFLPNQDYNGSPGRLSARLADGSSGSIAFSANANLSGLTGGTTPWSSASVQLAITVNSVNDQPSIGAIGNRSTTEDVTTSSGSFTVTDVEDPSSTTFTIGSSNTAVVAATRNPTAGASGVTISGTGGTRTITVTPVANRSTTVDNAGNPVTITVNWFDSAGASASSTFTVTITPTNDAPVGSAVSVPTILEDTAAGSISGTALSTLYAGAGFSDTADAPAANAFAGLAIVGNASTAAQGEWQVSSDGGNNWTNVRRHMTPDPLSDSAAIVLAPSAQVRFVPAADFSGTPGVLNVRVAEDSGGALTTGSTINLGSTGGASRWAATQTTIGVSVTSAADAPTLVGGVTPTLAAVVEDTSNPVGDTVSSLFTAAFSDAADGNATTLSAVAVVGNSAPTSQGRWQWSADGTTWTNIDASVSDAAALVLPTTHLIRFLPAADFHGTPTSLQVRLGDGSPGAEAQGTRSISASIGGAGRWTQSTVGLTTTVTPLNDAPTVVGNPAALVVAEDTANPAGQLVSAIFGGSGVYSDATDTSAFTTLGAVAVIGNNATASQGVWQYRATSSSSWSNVPTTGLSSTTALVLPASYELRFKPPADFNNDAGVAGSLTVRLGDQSKASAITFASARNLTLSSGGSIGGTGVWSQQTAQLGASVTPLNDTPVATTTIG
ncbi:MAG: DUF4347 domain-containing protein, partial [Rubrivivax sp.]